MAKQKKTDVTATASTPVAPKVKTQTLGEFKAWLSGVEEMQSQDWAPDLTQWRRIRERIENIVESAKPFKSSGAGPQVDYEHPAAPVVYRPAGPSLMTPQMMGPAAPPPTFMNTSDADGARLKTPNVDTSGGQYSSSLE